MFGKWHLGHSQENFHPNQRGFDYFYGHLHTEVATFSPFSNQGGIDFQRMAKPLMEQGYSTFLLAEEASNGLIQEIKINLFLCMYLS